MKLSIKKVFHCSVKKMRTKEKFHFLDIPAFLPLGPIIQKPFLLFWQNMKWQKISICQFKKGLTFGLGKLLPFEILMAKGYKNDKKNSISKRHPCTFGQSLWYTKVPSMWFWSVSWWTNCPVYFSFFFGRPKIHLSSIRSFLFTLLNFLSSLF